MHQIEQAIRRSRTDDSDAAKVIMNLQDLLHKAQEQLPQNEADESSDVPERNQGLQPSREATIDENLTLDDAENPLQLLARASDLQLSPLGPRNGPKSPVPLSSSTRVVQSTNLNLSPDESGAKSFFVPVRASRDVGPGLDPIEIGLVTLDEAETLFSL